MREFPASIYSGVPRPSSTKRAKQATLLDVVRAEKAKRWKDGEERREFRKRVADFRGRHNPEPPKWFLESFKLDYWLVKKST